MPTIKEPEAQAKETETKENTKKAIPGLDRKVKHLGTFTNFRNKEISAYIAWYDDNEDKRGWKLCDAKTGKEFKPGVLYKNIEHIKHNRVKFAISGKTEPIK